MELTGSVALVTGAGRRLGRAIALGLAQRGSQVIVHYGTSEAAAHQVVAEIGAGGGRAAALQADLADPAAIERLFETIASRWPRLDVVVNSAARFERQAFDEIAPGDWDRVLAVNLRAPFLVTQHAARRMRATPRESPGLVVNIADLSGLQVWHEYVQHGVAKAGLLHLTRLAARELAPAVRVNAIVPGAILPPPGMDAADEAWRAFGQRLPLQRVGEPGDVVHAVCFLAENDFVTGAILPVDGGEHLVGVRRH